MEDIFKIGAAISASISVSAAIILSHSSWFGKVWASRILETEKHRLEVQLEETKKELDILKEKTLSFQNDKLVYVVKEIWTDFVLI